VITTKSNIKSLRGVLMVLSIVGSFLAFQDFATPAHSRIESTRTEWVSFQKNTKRTVSFDANQGNRAYPASQSSYCFIELNYSRQIRTALASTTAPPRLPCRNVLEKTVAGLPESDPAHQG
jgi:hypothetical protein